MTNTKNTPIEALERAFPLRVLRQRLRRGSGGARRSRGGEGIERDLEQNWLLPGGDGSRAERLPDKCTIQLKVGDVLRM